MTDPVFCPLWLEGLRKSCAAACRMGASYLISRVGPDTGQERAVQHASIAQTLRQAVPILEEYGITLMIDR